MREAVISWIRESLIEFGPDSYQDRFHGLRDFAAPDRLRDPAGKTSHAIGEGIGTHRYERSIFIRENNDGNLH